MPGKLNVRGCPVLHFIYAICHVSSCWITLLISQRSSLVQISVQDHVQFGDTAFACTDIHLGRLRTWDKAFVAWAGLNLWLPDWHHPHLHPAWIFPFSSSTLTLLILGHSQILFRWAWGTSRLGRGGRWGGKEGMSTPPQKLLWLLSPTWFVVTHKPQPPHQWVGQKIKFDSLCRGNDEQLIARRCLDGAVVWCPYFYGYL